jgi:arylsulfatase A-like enzyme
MTDRPSFLRLLKLLLAIHISFGLLAGYLDIRLSDSLLYTGQMAKIHYLRTMRAHFLLGVLAALFLAAILTWYYTRRRIREINRRSFISTQSALAISYLFLLIIGIKIHLVWLQTHITDPQGLLWTTLLLVATAVLFWLLLKLVGFLYDLPIPRLVVATLFLIGIIWIARDISLHKTPRMANGASHPSVLLIVVDTLRWDHLSSYGYSRKTTPHIDQIATNGLLFETTISASPWTTPSHAALFTGQYPSKTGVDGRNIVLDPARTTLAEILRRAGYQTAGFINNVYIRKQTGLARGFQQYEEFWGRNEGSSIMLLLEFLRERLNPRPDTGAKETVAAVEHWLDLDWNKKNPFFLFVHFMEPHTPYGVPDQYARNFLPSDVSLTEAKKVNQDPEMYVCGKLKMTNRDFRILNDLYDNDIRYLDDQIGALLENFRKRNLLDRTLIIFTADHGEHFGEHGLMSHELSVYEDLIHVPLILGYRSRLPKGERVAQINQTIDIAPTILELAGLNTKNLEPQGQSLVGKRDTNGHAFAEYDNARAVDKIERRFSREGFPPNPIYRRKVLKAVRSQDWKLIWGTDGTRELYFISNDPHEQHNLYESHPDQAKQLQGVLAKWLASFRPSRFYRQEEVSREALEELKALGYVQ